jgi:hypothetical protein
LYHKSLQNHFISTIVISADFVEYIRSQLAAHLALLHNCDRVRLRLTGETIDVNYYDGSRPATKLSVDVWFDRNRDRGRSMS